MKVKKNVTTYWNTFVNNVCWWGKKSGYYHTNTCLFNKVKDVSFSE
jgi:hypothetical protein